MMYSRIRKDKLLYIFLEATDSERNGETTNYRIIEEPPKK